MEMTRKSFVKGLDLTGVEMRLYPEVEFLKILRSAAKNSSKFENPELMKNLG